MMAIINATGNNNSTTKLSSTHTHHCNLVPSSSSSNSSSMEDENVICPLCMENLDIDDRSFYPCTCGYQICRFCWHRIRSESDDQNGLCPACRKQYSENPATFKPLSSEDIQKLKLQKRQKDQQKKQKSENGKRHLADLRVVQKNLVFVVGISPRIADPDVLKKNEFFGKFGKIHKVVVNPCLQGTTASAYITYIKSDDALRAIQSVNNIPFDGKTIKVSLGTTKYCSHFMRNQTCPKTECMYLHHYGDPDASFTKEDMQAGKHQDYEKKLLEEFNSNNNNNNDSNGEKCVNGVKEIKSGKRIANGSSIQQGVSYSTKLLVNQHPPQSTTPPDPKPESTPPAPSTTPPCSSSASSTSSEHQVTQATSLLEHTTLSEEESGEEEYHESVSQPVPVSDPVPDDYDGDFGGGSTLDLDFDPFHETQKAFEEIINEQVGGEVGEENSLLRRFIKPVQEERCEGRDYLLGFHHNNTTQPQNQLPQTPQTQSYNTPQQNSLLLDFFNNYAYKQPQLPSQVPPPPGFQPTQPQAPLPQSQSSSALLEKLNRTLLGTNQAHWGDLEEPRVITNTTADWMSLDPAIIFSKTSTERIAEQRGRGFVDQGGFGDRGQAGQGAGNHFFERERVFREFQSSVQTGNHSLIRPTPTTTSQSYYPLQNQPQQFNYNRSYYPAVQSRYYPQQQTTPPPPGFNHLVSPGKPNAQQFSSQNVYAMQQPQTMHNGSGNSAGFFPF